MELQAVTGDASAGHAGCEIVMDDRFCSLVSWASFNINQGTPADADFRLALFGGAAPSQVLSGLSTSVAVTLTARTIGQSWYPKPFILAGGVDVATIQVVFENVLADVYTFSALIYLFDIRVRETTPIAPLLWAAGSI